ncbi:MAG TPA: hypothetical protein VER33_06655, partial [Polyangiaceae bacterium]|nr:hypothetical protein [Polyangiaceae bacterium]
MSGEMPAFNLEFPAIVRLEPRWYALCATRLEGDGLGLVAIEHRDVTEARRASDEVQRSEMALRQQTHILNSIVNSMSEGV